MVGGCGEGANDMIGDKAPNLLYPRCRLLAPNPYLCHPTFKPLPTAMAVTRLKRKDRRNAATATNRVERIKQLTRKPVIKNIDIEAIKAEWAAKA